MKRPKRHEIKVKDLDQATMDRCLDLMTSVFDYSSCIEDEEMSILCFHTDDQDKATEMVDQLSVVCDGLSIECDGEKK